MEVTVDFLPNVFLAVCLSVSMTTVIFGCAFCLRYITSMTSGGEPVIQAKMAALRKGAGTQQASYPTPLPAISVEIEPDPPEKSLEAVTIDDLGSSFVQDQKCFSDTYSFSDITTSPGESPLASPMSTPAMHHKKLYRLHSDGTLSYQTPMGKVTEGKMPSFRDPKRSLSYEGQREMNLSMTGSHRPKRRRSLGLKRSLSVPDIRDTIKPEITFNIFYDDRKYSLIINQIQVSNLSLSARDIAIKMNLCPTDKCAITETVPVPAVGAAKFDLDLEFYDLNESDLDRLSLLVTLTCVSGRAGRKIVSMGEVLIKVSELEVNVGTVVKVTRSLHHRRRIRKKSTSTNCLSRELGDLFVLLQYQSHANRVKVLVRKAARLPSGGKLPGQPDHFVLVALRCGHEMLTTRATHAQKGTDPVWNEPFLFDVSGHDISDISLEFTIYRGRIYTKDGVLGHVVIGGGAPSRGLSHWKEVISPRGTETARWHAILPLFQY